MRRSAFVVAVVAALGVSPLSARANGRYPASNGIFFSPTDPATVLLRTTFGVIVSSDRGNSWDWVCDRSMGLSGDEDPMFAVTPDGTFIASTYSGLALTRDRACSFSYAGGEPSGLVFIDVAARPGQPENVFAFSSGYDTQTDAGDILYRSSLFETTDQGKTFSRVGGSFDPSLRGETVDLTATDPDRVYVSAVRDPQTTPKAILLVSRDRGKTFVEEKIPLEDGDRAAFIAAVDPLSADRVYVRTAAEADKPSRLLVTDDAGKTFRVVFRARAGLAGFAISADGSKVWVGSSLDGVHMARTTDFAFTKKAAIEVQCLAFAGDGLWACSSEQSGFVAGLSKDDGATFETKLHFCDIRGPLACPPGTSTNVECAGGGTGASAVSPWPTLRGLLGCGAPDGGAPGSGDAGSEAGDVALAGGGSACSTGAASVSALAAALAAAFAVVATLARRLTARRRPS